MPKIQHELDNDLPDYLVFLILSHIRNLREIAPDHILVKAVEQALNEDDPGDYSPQSSFDFDGSLMP